MARLRPLAVLTIAAVALCWVAAGASAQTAPAAPPVEARPVAASPGPVAAVPDGAQQGRSLGSVQPGLHDMSPWAMFLGADVVVKAVMLGLAFASLVTWTILFAKTFEFLMLRRRMAWSLSALCDCFTLAEAEGAFPARRGEVVSALVSEAAEEARLSDGIGPGGGIRERAGARCTEVIRAEGRRLRVGTGLLATIGATAPFVGLFGTVWGIMNSFVGIAKAQTTNLAVVAPGIAEALLATAIGLVAAIPAVIIYNHFARVTKNHLELVNRAAGMVLRLLSRDLDRSRQGGGLRIAAE